MTISTSSSENIQLKAIIKGETSLLLQLLAFCFPKLSSHSNASLLDREQTLSLLTLLGPVPAGKLCEATTEKHELLETLSNENYALLRFSDKLFPHYLNNCQFDSELRAHFEPLTAIFGSTLLGNPHWLWDSEHPLQQLLTQLQHHCIGWQANAGKAAERFAGQLSRALQQLHADWRNGECDFSSNPLTELFIKEHQRLSKLEKRLKDTETGALRAKRCQELSIRLLNDKMRNKQLPLAISLFLQNSWRDSLILLLVNSDDINREYQRLSKLTETFIWTFQAFNPEDKDMQQRIYRFIPSLQEELHTLTISLKHEPEKLEQSLSNIEAEHLKILKGEPLHYQDFSLIECNNPLNTASTQISRTLLKQVNQLHEGQWLLQLNKDNEEKAQRIKLLVKLNDSQQLLFSNHNGIKACQYSFEEFAYKLSTKAFKLLPINSRLTQQATQLTENLLQLQQQQKDKTEQRELDQKDQQEAIEKQRLLAREKALREAKAIHDREQQKILKQKAVQQAKQQKQAQQDASKDSTDNDNNNDKQRAAETKLRYFHVGGIICFSLDESPPKKCKLAAKTQNPVKYIFVNNSGLKDCELSKQELIHQLANGKAEIINNGDEFEDVLSKVVSNLRNKKQ